MYAKTIFVWLEENIPAALNVVLNLSAEGPSAVQMTDGLEAFVVLRAKKILRVSAAQRRDGMEIPAAPKRDGPALHAAQKGRRIMMGSAAMMRDGPVSFVAMRVNLHLRVYVA